MGKFIVHDNEHGTPNIYIKSKLWDIDLCKVTDILKYEPWAKQRTTYYSTVKHKKDKTFENWLIHLWVEAKKGNDNTKAKFIRNELSLAGVELNIEDYKHVLEEKETQN